jgi:hypothetical protein
MGKEKLDTMIYIGIWCCVAVSLIALVFLGALVISKIF